MYNRILVLVNDNPRSGVAVFEGIGVAKSHRAEVLFLYILKTDSVLPRGFTAESRRLSREVALDSHIRGSRELQKAAVIANAAGVTSRRVMSSGISDAKCIAEVAKRRECDLIVLASAQTNMVFGLYEYIKFQRLIHSALVPILMCIDTPRRVQRSIDQHQLKHLRGKISNREEAFENA